MRRGWPVKEKGVYCRKRSTLYQSRVMGMNSFDQDRTEGNVNEDIPEEEAGKVERPPPVTAKRLQGELYQGFEQV